MVLWFYACPKLYKEASYQILLFSTHIQFTTIYLLQEQKLKYNNYSEQQINMSNFVKAK
jgi:hypothetical protein